MLKLTQTDWGQFDLVFDANANRDPQTAFATLVYAVIFTDAEADDSLVSERYERRGWWFDSSAGTQVWALRQQSLSKETRAAVIDNITNALASHSALSNVVVIDITPVRNVSTLLLSISATYNSVNSLVQVEL